MSKSQPSYTREFKQQAVQLFETSGKAKTQIARDLGISDSALSKWCKEFSKQGEEAFPGKGHQTAVEEETATQNVPSEYACDDLSGIYAFPGLLFAILLTGIFGQNANDYFSKQTSAIAFHLSSLSFENMRTICDSVSWDAST